jgi:hypothetical protein
MNKQQQVPADRGEIGINIMADVKSGYVTINLGTKVQCMAIDNADALEFVEDLIEAANKLPATQ